MGFVQFEVDLTGIWLFVLGLLIGKKWVLFHFDYFEGVLFNLKWVWLEFGYLLFVC